MQETILLFCIVNDCHATSTQAEKNEPFSYVITIPAQHCLNNGRGEIRER